MLEPPSPHQHNPSTYWRALIHKLNRKEAALTQESFILILDSALALIFGVGVYGIYQSLLLTSSSSSVTSSSPSSSPPAPPVPTPHGLCRDVSLYVYLLTFGLGLYLAQNTLHRLQRRLLIAVWRRHDNKDVQAEDVVAHVRGLQRLEVLRDHATPGLPMLFLFSWLYAGAVDLHSGCMTRYPALGVAFHLFSWTGYSVAMVCVVLLIVQCVCVVTSNEPSDSGGGSSSNSSSGSGSGSFDLSSFPLQALVASEWFVPVRKAITMVLGPLGLLLPTELLSPGYNEYEGDVDFFTAPTPTSTSFLFSSLHQQEQQQQEQQRHIETNTHNSNSSTVVEESISDLEYLHHGHTHHHRRRGPLGNSTTTNNSHNHTHIHTHHYRRHYHHQPTVADEGHWLIPPEIIQTALDTSPFGISRRNPRSGSRSSSLSSSSSSSRRFNSSMTTTHQPTLTSTTSTTTSSTNPPASSSSSTTTSSPPPPSTAPTLPSRFLGPLSSASPTTHTHAHTHTHSSPSYSVSQILSSALWACLHVTIICLLTMSFYLLGSTAALPPPQMETCGCVRGYLFTLSIAFTIYLALAVWLWAEKERSMREDPQEHALKALWLVRGLVCILSIGFVWGMMVMNEKECFVLQPKLQEAVVAFILLGSSLLVVALALHGIATAVWVCMSVVKVTMGVCEAGGLFVSLACGLAPREDVFCVLGGGRGRGRGGQGQVKWLQVNDGGGERRQQSQSQSVPSLMIQVAEELPLLPFFHIRVIEEASGQQGGRQQPHAHTPQPPHQEQDGAVAATDRGEESKQQQQGQEQQPQPLTTPVIAMPRATSFDQPLHHLHTPSTPIGRVLQSRRRRATAVAAASLDGEEDSTSTHTHTHTHTLDKHQQRGRNRLEFRVEDEGEEGKGRGRKFVDKEEEKEEAKQGGREGLGMRKAEGEAHDSEEEEEEGESEEEDASLLPAAVPVALAPRGTNDQRHHHHQQRHPPPLILAAATLHSIFDVTPLSLSPPRLLAAGAAGAAVGEGMVGGGEGGRQGGNGSNSNSSNNSGPRPVVMSGNTCCPLPPLPSASMHV